MKKVDVFLAQSGFIGCFDAQWPKLSYIIHPDLNHPQEMYKGGKFLKKLLCYIVEQVKH